ncbi:hypothetical protein C5167_005807 [Papaver somniferum]|uniref:Uncharacterized protein n=1 Tax=Papaver somniferum TaxID=3469 RepID=A0A4Y7JBM6_PAPSO|nr:hypothetical protein C5167_005807 [Papaver somniferum]
MEPELGEYLTRLEVQTKRRLVEFRLQELGYLQRQEEYCPRSWNRAGAVVSQKRKVDTGRQAAAVEKGLMLL